MAQRVVHLGLGSNLGDRAANLLRAIVRLSRQGIIVDRLSSIYETDPVGYLDQPPFLNQVLAGRTAIEDPWSLLRLCLTTENELGRQREIPLGPRTIDIDLLLFDDWHVDGRRDGVDLSLPHPRMHERRFVLTPLAEIDPEIVHPVLGETAVQLLASLADQSHVSAYL